MCGYREVRSSSTTDRIEHFSMLIFQIQSFVVFFYISTEFNRNSKTRKLFSRDIYLNCRTIISRLKYPGFNAKWLLANFDLFYVLTDFLSIQWNFDLRKPHYTKNSGYEMGFEEISTPFNEKIFKIRKRKSKVSADLPRIHFVASRERLSILTFM